MSDPLEDYFGTTRYYATYSMGEVVSEDPLIPVGGRREDEEGFWDTLFYHVRLSMSDPEDEARHVGDLRIRRVQISKIVNERRSVFESMDQIDSFEHEIYEAVWDDEMGGFKENFEAMCGDLVIFEDLTLKEGAVLPGFDINKILDDMAYHVGGDSGMVVYAESYANFTRFNLDACHTLEGVGFARASTMAGLSVERREPDLDDDLDI